MAERSFEGPEGHQAEVSISAGIAELRDGMADPEALIAAADRALYRAK